jgi:hypothetical protein
VVAAQRIRREAETSFKVLTASLFYHLLAHLSTVPIPHEVGDFRLLDRRVVDVVVGMREQHRFLRGLCVWVGFRQEVVPYVRQERFAGTTKFPLRNMLCFSLDGITGFSVLPLHLATKGGAVLISLSLLGIVLTILLRLFTKVLVGQICT